MLRMATDAGNPGRDNEDFVGAIADAVVLVDGAGISGVEELCRHGIAWYSHRLGTALLARLSLAASAAADPDLADVLAAAIDEVTDSHRDTCDVADASSPSATVAILRVARGRADHLVLGDSVIVLDVVGGPPEVVEDRREVETARPFREALAELEHGSREHDRVREDAVTAFRARRNQPGGFWVAKDDGRVAAEARTGTRPAAELGCAALLSNGASRVVDRFGLLDWAQVPTHDPHELIGLVRRAERAAAVGADDATVACWQRDW